MLMKTTVGREHELQRMERLFAEVAGGAGRTCFISGEAGSGKSTLVQEFVARALDARDDVIVAIGSCDAQIGIGDPYLPFLDVVGSLTGHVESKVAQGKLSENAASRLRRVAGMAAHVLISVAPDLLGTLVPGGSLIGRFVEKVADSSGLKDRLKRLGGTNSNADARIDQQQIFDSYERFLRGLTKQPVILVLDDLHWADAPSCALLFHLSQKMRDAPLFLIGTFRANDVALGYAGARHPLTPVLNELKRYQGDIVIDLDNHDERRRRQFVRDLIDVEPNAISDSWCDALFRHTGGHALFTVELLTALQERQVLTQNERGQWVASLEFDWSMLPSRVEGVIEERIGRLESELREVLSVASVEGEVFTAEVVARIQEIAERDLLRKLSEELGARHRLVAEGDVTRIGRSFVSHYAFTHALFQQYFYEHLGRRERMLLHDNVADLIEQLYAGRTDDVAPQLARHYALAGNAEKAFEYVLRLASRAIRLSAYEEALLQTVIALDVLPDIEKDRDSRELEVQLIRATAYQATQGWAGPKTIATLARARELAADLPPSPHLISLLFGEFAELLTSGRFQEAHVVAERMGGLGNDVVAAVALGTSAFWLGRLTESTSVGAEGLKNPATTDVFIDGPLYRVVLLRQMMLNELILNDAEAADRYREEMLAVAGKSAHPFTICIADAGDAWDAYQRRDPVRARLAAARGLAAGVQTFPFYGSQLSLFNAWAAIAAGELDAVEQLDQAYAALRQQGTYFHSVFVAMKADALVACGKVEEALEWIASGIERAIELSDLAYLSELHRQHGDILVALGKRNDAVESYRAAVEIAKTQNARLFETRAAAALDLVADVAVSPTSR
ncbi:MAG TPA: AAA family ATPase [Thermoanaerobaculia bacterium]